LCKKIKKNSHFLKGLLLDIGCGRKPYKKILTRVEKYIGIEVPDSYSKNEKIDIYADALELPFKNNVFDCVLSTQVLEHISEPNVFFKEAYRVLKSGGVLLLTTSQVWPLHEEPYDYFRYTEYGLENLAEENNFEIIKIEKTTGTILALGQLLSDYIHVQTEESIILKYPTVIVCAFIQILTIILGFLTINSGKLTLDYMLLARKKADNQINLKTKQLNKILCCPKCKSDLKFNNDKMVCRGCGVRYKIISGKPVFTSFSRS